MNCPECNSENLLKKGFRKGKQRYQCKDCGRNFVEGTKYVGRQVKLPTLVKSCPTCQSTNIIRDGKLESGARRFKCKDCGKRFSSKTFMRPPVEYKCPYCGGKLNRSGKSKLGESQYICATCGKSCTGDPPVKRFSFKERNTSIKCPYCDSLHIVLRGIEPKTNLTKYMCRSCNH